MIVSIIMIALLALAWVFSTIFVCAENRPMHKKVRWIVYAAGVLMLVGAAGFFGSALSAVGALNFLPSSVEWPVGFASNILTMENGDILVPHISSGRIQVYDKDLRFVRGWHVDARGGVFKTRTGENGTIEAVTARGNQKIIFNERGAVVSTEEYTCSYDAMFLESGKQLYIPTPFYLIAFSHPFIAWIFGIVGIVVLGIVKRTKRTATPEPFGRSAEAAGKIGCHA
jgi:hypothetical protein